ncbi:hypothetical protein FQZ97_578680 [compost metagenome]
MFPRRLIDGYGAFLEKRFANEHGRYKLLAEKGQHPEIMVIGCVDSRVSPEVFSMLHPANCSWFATWLTWFHLTSGTATPSTAPVLHWNLAYKPS